MRRQAARVAGSGGQPPTTGGQPTQRDRLAPWLATPSLRMIGHRHFVEGSSTMGVRMNAGYVRRPGGRKTRAGLGLCLAPLAGVTLATASASAAPASNTQTVSVQSNEADLGGFKLQAPVVIPDLLPVPIVLTDLTVSATATWS